MDKPITIEPPMPSTSTHQETLALDIKQEAYKDAFDSALQRADGRRNVDSQDQIVTADVNPIQLALTTQEAGRHSNFIAESMANVDAFVDLKELPKAGQVGADYVDTRHGLFHAQLRTHDFTGSSYAALGATGSSRALSDESLAMLFKKINLAQGTQSESISLELLEDPSGVLEITLTKGLDNGWQINLVLASQEGSVGADQEDLSTNLISHLQESGIAVDSLSIAIRADASSSAVT